MTSDPVPPRLKMGASGKATETSESLMEVLVSDWQPPDYNPLQKRIQRIHGNSPPPFPPAGNQLAECLLNLGVIPRLSSATAESPA
ncbi:MAG: hypothetical protein ACM37W_01155 [Actinomycetota bacterium]